MQTDSVCQGPVFQSDRFLAHASCTAVSLSKHVLSLGVGWLVGGELFQSVGHESLRQLCAW